MNEMNEAVNYGNHHVIDRILCLAPFSSLSITYRQIRWQLRAGFRVARQPRLASRAEERCAIQNLFLKLFEIEINHRRDVKRDELRDYQAADYHQPQRSPRRT